MAFAVVQSQAFTADDVSSHAPTLTSNPVAGNAIVALVTLRRDLNAGPNVSTVTGGGGSAWTELTAATNIGDSRTVEVWYSQNVAGGATTITFTFDAASRYSHITLVEVSGMGSGTVDVVGASLGETGNQSTFNHGQVTTASGVESIIFTVFVTTGGFTINTNIASHTTLQTTTRSHTTYRIVASQTTTNPSLVINESLPGNACTAAMSLPASSVVRRRGRLMMGVG